MAVKKKKQANKNKKARRAKTAMNQKLPKGSAYWKGNSLPKTVSGEKFVKKAGMTITYTNYNDGKTTDIQTWK